MSWNLLYLSNTQTKFKVLPKYPCYCFCVSRGRSMFWRLADCLPVRVSHRTWNALFNYTSWPANLKDPPDCLPSAGIVVTCHHAHLFFFFLMGNGDPKCRSPILWGKHISNWCTPYPVPFTVVFKSLLFSFHSMEWDEMIHETMPHCVFERR